MNLLLIDDQNIVREALAHALAAQGGIDAVIQAESAREALAALARHRCQVAVLELSLGDRSGTELIRQIKVRGDVKVVVLSTFRDEFRVAEAMRAGADGYLSKRARISDLVEAIQAVARGRTAVSPDVSAAMVRALHSAAVRASCRRADPGLR